MRILRTLFGATLSLSLAMGCVFAHQGNDGAATGSTIYFLRDDLHGQWCAYSSESRFREQVQSVVARFAGGADFSEDHILMLHVDETDDSGDWDVYDVYSFDIHGKMRSLKRNISIIPGGAREQQFFLIKNGKAVKRRQVGPGKEVQKFVDWFKPPPVIVNLEAAPFSVLIGRKRAQVLSNGELCIPTESQK